MAVFLFAGIPVRDFTAAVGFAMLQSGIP